MRRASLASRANATPSVRERGMSAIELVVTLAIVTLVFILASASIVQLSQQAASAGTLRPIVGGETDLALDLMERDLRDAIQIVPVTGGRDSAKRLIVVRLSTGGRVSWERHGSDLVRIETATGEPPFEKVVATDVLLVDFPERSAHLRDVVLRRGDEPIRYRTVLLRNLGRRGYP